MFKNTTELLGFCLDLLGRTQILVAIHDVGTLRYRDDCGERLWFEVGRNLDGKGCALE